jgi:hypothetical protein
LTAGTGHEASAKSQSVCQPSGSAHGPRVHAEQHLRARPRSLPAASSEDPVERRRDPRVVDDDIERAVALHTSPADREPPSDGHEDRSVMSSPIFVWAWAHPISQTRAAASGLNASSRRTTPRSRNAPLIPCGARVRTAIPSTELPPPGCSSSHAAMSAPRSAAWSGRHAPSLQCSQLLLPRRAVRPLRHRSARVGPPSLDDRLRGLRRTARGWTSHDRVRMKPAQCRRFPWKSGAATSCSPN